MNRNEIITEILTNMPENIKDGKSLDELKLKARYLYLELCKRCHYDFEYNIADIDTQNKLFNKNSSENKENVGLCNDFCLMGVKLFKRAGLDAMAIDVEGNEYIEGQTMKNPLHIYFLFSLYERDGYGNKKFYLADPAFDLKRVQIGCATKYFASQPSTIKNRNGYLNSLYIIPTGEIKVMDEKLGYCKDEYTDKLVRNIIDNMQNTKYNGRNEFDNLILKVNTMLDALKTIIPKGADMGISDRQSSYKMIFHQAFKDEMNKNMIDFNIVKGDKGSYESTLKVKKGENVREYLFSEDEGGYVEKEEELDYGLER